MLVFFDIECASVYKYTAKICAFGYVLCDEEFNVIEKRDILVNPKGKFHLTGNHGEDGIVLPYEYSEFKNYPSFPHIYNQIKELLEDKNNLVYGHATLNDVKYLDLETNRFRLPPFNFYFSDSQLEYMTSVGDFSRQFGLEYITANLDVEFTPHRAADDAYATMRVVQALCKKHNCTCRELDDVLGVKRGRIKNHKIIKPTSKAYGEYIAGREKRKRERAECRSKFFIYVSRRKSAKVGSLKGARFMFSRPLEEDLQRSLPLIDGLYALGGKYAARLEECTHYVCDEQDDTTRSALARQNQAIGVFTPCGLQELFDA